MSLQDERGCTPLAIPTAILCFEAVIGVFPRML